MSLKLETVSKMKLTDGDMKVLLSEKYSTYGKEILYVPIPDQNKVIPITTNNSLSGHIQGGLRKFFQEIFLPQGYPTSVSSDYTQYQIWDTAQAFCSTITGTLATHSVMKGVGVGNIEATPLAATITWVLKEVTGNFGRIAFAWWKGTSLDADSKRWRLVADCLNDAAICLEVALPLFEGYTTYVLCVSTAMKSIVGVAGGATRAALTQHQAIRGNLADVAAKDGSQETAVNIIASFAAIMIISLVGQNIWPVFFIFTLFHIISNYLAVSSVCLNTFNTTRYLNTIGHFLKCGNIPSPKQVNSEEPVFFFQNRITDEMTCGFKIKVGESLKYLVESGKISLKQLEVAIEVHQESKYLIVFNMHEKCVHIILNDTATSEDVNCGYFNAIVFGTILSRVKNINCQAANFISKEIYNPSFLKYNENDPDDTPSIEVFREIYETTVILWEKFHKASIIEGWNLDKNLIISQEFRAVWNFEKKEK